MAARLVGQRGVSCRLDESLSYCGYRYPFDIINQAVWLYFGFNLSLRDVDELLAERGVNWNDTPRFRTHLRLVLLELGESNRNLQLLDY